MIEAIMYLAIGALLAGLLCLALLPALWRRAMRLSRERLIATLPLTPNEIAAEKDQIRAAGVVEIRRLEQRADASDAALQRARKEIGEQVRTLQEREATIAEKLQAIAGLEADLAARHEDIAALKGRYQKLKNERDNLASNLDATRIFNQELDQESLAQRQLAEQRLARLGEQDRQIAMLSEKTGELQAVVAALREDLRRKTDDLRTATRSLRETTAQKSTLERRMTAAEKLAQDRAAQIEHLQAERLRQIEDSGQLVRERDSERIEREARDSEIARLSTRISELDMLAGRARIAHDEIMRDLTATIETLRQEKHQGDAEMATIRLDKARGDAKLTQRRPRAARAQRSPAE